MANGYSSDTDAGARIDVWIEDNGIEITISNGDHVDDTWTLALDEAEHVLHGLVTVLFQKRHSDRPHPEPDHHDLPDNELPGMWERADFEGGSEEARP